MDKPVFDKGLVLPDKLICLSKTRVSNAWGLPRGMLMPSPRGRDKIANAQLPGLTTWANALRLPRGGGESAPLELIDALIANSGKFMKITFFDSVPFSLYHLGFTYW